MMFLCLPVFLNVIHVWYMPWNSCPKSRRTWICHCPFLSVFVGCTMKFWRHLGDRIPLLCWSRCRLWLNGLVHRIRGREWRKPDGDQPWLLIDVGMMVLESHRIHGAGIYANMWGILMVNVTIYIPYMDPMGMVVEQKNITTSSTDINSILMLILYYIIPEVLIRKLYISVGPIQNRYSDILCGFHNHHYYPLVPLPLG